MSLSVAIKEPFKENFHKICVVGGGITGAMMVLLLKNQIYLKLK